MADSFADVAACVKRLEAVADTPALKRILSKAGAAGKKSALDAARADLGGDLAMSNLRNGRAKLSVGYDPAGLTSVALKFRGPWTLASEGRQSAGVIKPKKRGGRRAVKTPNGPRASSRYGRSRGLDTTDDAVRDAKRTVPKAAAEQFTAEIRKAVL